MADRARGLDEDELAKEFAGNKSRLRAVATSRREDLSPTTRKSRPRSALPSCWTRWSHASFDLISAPAVPDGLEVELVGGLEIGRSRV